MRFSVKLSFVLAALTVVPSLALPLQGGQGSLLARSPEPAPEPGKPSWFPTSKGGNGGNAQTGNSGNVDGGSVYQETSPWGYIYNGYGAGK